MAQEEHGHWCSNSSSGGGPSGSGGGCGGGGGGGGDGGSISCRKMKQKKVPQRGLGVAQLEKIRLEEQQKKKATLHSTGVVSPNQVINPSNSSSCFGVQYPPSTFRPSISNSSRPFSLPPPPSPNDIPSPNSTFRTAPSIPIADILHQNSVPFSKPLNVGVGGGGGLGWPAVHGNWPKVWNGEYNVEGENLRMDCLEFSLPSDLNFGYDSSNNPLLHLPSFAQGPQQLQPSPPSSLMSVSTGISSPPVLNFHQMEPPSNQSFYSNNCPPLWPDEEKMIGMKRPYPFSMETPLAPNFHLKYPPCYVAPVSRMDVPASSSNRCLISTDPFIDRDVPVKSNIVSQPTWEEVKENCVLNGYFLSLGPPVAGSPHINSCYKQILANSGHQGQGLFDFGSQPSRGHNEDNFLDQRPNKAIRRTFFSFLPSSKEQNDQKVTLINNCKGEVAEATVDFSLKL